MWPAAALHHSQQGPAAACIMALRDDLCLIHCKLGWAEQVFTADKLSAICDCMAKECSYTAHVMHTSLLDQGAVQQLTDGD